MEWFTVERLNKGAMHGIRCPECKISSFLSKEAIGLYNARCERVSEQVPQASQRPEAVAPPAPQVREPKSLLDLLEEALDDLFK